MDENRLACDLQMISALDWDANSMISIVGSIAEAFYGSVSEADETEVEYRIFRKL